jgi:mannose-6-phosphate isomerase
MGIPYQNAAHFPLQSCIFATGAQQPAKVYPELKGPVQLQNVMATKTGVAKFWYILDAAPHAEVTVGISPRASGQRLRHNLRSPELKNFLQTFRARAGDSYVIPPGIVHSAGRDVVIWEIQLGQQSPLTISNWHATENVSEEEQQAALKAMSLHPRQTIRRPKSTGTASHSHRLPLTSNFPFFIVEEVRLKDHMFLQTNGKSFDLFFALDGQTLLEFQGDLWTIEKGDFWCVPACLETYKIVTATDSARLLRACMPQ